MGKGPGKEATDKEIILPSFKATETAIANTCFGRTNPGALGQEHVYTYKSVDLVYS